MKANYLPHLAGRVFGVPLLIQPQKLSVILQAIGPRLGLRQAEIEIEGLGTPVVARMPLDEADDPDETDGAARSQKPYLVTPEGVAVIGVSLGTALLLGLGDFVFSRLLTLLVK